MNESSPATSNKETDFLIVGAGAMGMAFADEIFTLKPHYKITIVDRRPKAGGHWNDAYPFVRLHQPAVFYGVNSLQLGNGSTDLSSKTEILEYYEKVIQKFEASGRVAFLGGHQYLGEGKVAPLDEPDKITQYTIKQKLVDASYMKVEVPATHPPKFKVEEGVSLVPLNQLEVEYNQWAHFYVIGSGKTGMDAVLYLLAKGVKEESIHWINPNDAWLFNRGHLQAGAVAEEILKHAKHLKTAEKADDIFLALEKTGGILRLDKNVLPVKWRCATVNEEELNQLRRIKQIIRKGRVHRIRPGEIELEQGSISYPPNSLMVDCTANGLAKRKKTPIFSEEKITLQSILFCQQVFSAATIARLALCNIPDEKKNLLTPVPHPEFKEDWPETYVTSIQNVLRLHRFFPFWMFRSRLNFMSHEPMLKYFAYSTQAYFLLPSIEKARARIKARQKSERT